MSTENGGEREHLAPVIPLFGGAVPQSPEHAGPRRPVGRRPPTPPEDDDPAVEAAFAEIVAAVERSRTRAAAAASSPVQSSESSLAATSPDSASGDSASPDRASGDGASPDGASGDGVDGPGWHPTWATDRRGLPDSDAPDAPDVDLAEKALLKKLRTRSLSVSEARGVLREYDLDAAAIEHVIASMDEYGYLDDAALADQLIHAGVDRKGQGRQVIAQTLAKRGIPRDVADAALASLPDDDFERALEFARTKARSLRSLDRETALRRLTGQLARRGYGGSIAMSAARAALDENPGGSSGVRFR